MLTERTIINVLIILGAVILTPFLVGTFLSGQFWPVAAVAAILAAIAAFFFLRERLSLFPMIGLSIVGNLNFLPLQLNAMHVFGIVVILYYVANHLLFKKWAFKPGKLVFLVPIVVLAAIVFYHDHDFGVHVLGGKQEGARRPILILLCVIVYFCGINLASPPVTFCRRLPLYAVIATIISSLPFIISTYFPATAPYFYFITDSVNVGAYLDTVGSAYAQDESTIGRMAVFASIALAIQLYLIVHYPLGSWWKPRRWIIPWWVPMLSICCLALTVASGYRNNLFTFAVITMLGAFCYHRWRAFFLPFSIGFALLLLYAASTSNLISIPLDKLPLIVQRSMSFLPGKWSAEAIESADSSNKWRQNIIDVYTKEYAAQSPLLGNGYAFDAKEYAILESMVFTGNDPEYYTAKVYITAKIPHTGWISLYDAVGIIGGVAFVFLGLAEIWVAGCFIFGYLFRYPQSPFYLLGYIFGRENNRGSPLYPLYIWIFCSVTSDMISFFTVFGDFAITFSSLCVYGIALSQLGGIKPAPNTEVVARPRNEPVHLAALSGAYQGYHAKS